MLDALDADAVRRWSRSAVDLLETHRAEIDALNVYPVADSDTGSNLVTTLRSADAALGAAQPANAGAALAEMAVGAAHGALGNSGFIVSQILRGLADATSGDLDAPAITAGLDRGAELARTAVVTPVEGTILTVARAASDGALGATLGEIVVNAVRAADVALQRTPSQLADLAQAGVVDAGGRGLVVLLEALARTITGVVTPIAPVRVPLRSASAAHGEGGDFAFEVQYLLEASSGAVDVLRDALADLGDSVAVVAVGEGVWNVHAHVDDVGAAIEAGVNAGRPYEISVVRFSDQMRDAAQRGAIAVVAVAPGVGLAHLFEAEGVHVVEGEGDSPPSVDAVLDAIRATGARDVVLLPNAARVSGVAEQAAERARAQGNHVSVVPTRSPVQGLAAIAVHDPTRRFDDDVIAMAEAAAATRHAELTVARTEALTAVGICQPGDILGLIDDDVVEIGRGMLAVAFTVVDRLLGVGAELMTVLVGADAPPRTGDQIKAHVRERAPFTDVTIYLGGQPDHPVIIGVE
ncbi:MAG: DAK2 domain-containing protein [Jatrophihabitans sp.]|uniref:DAK2 domain-containing protein n=1 Tax=Jatrophihabitans sp. TaxID=1932789 RepID=UPI00390D8204